MTLFRAVVKTALPNNQNSSQDLNRELETYQKLKSGSDRYIRKFYDTVDDPKSLVFEYMEYTLATLTYDECKHSYSIIKAVIEATFCACATLNEMNLVDTGKAYIHKDLAPTNKLRYETRQDYDL